MRPSRRFFRRASAWRAFQEMKAAVVGSVKGGGGPLGCGGGVTA